MPYYVEGTGWCETEDDIRIRELEEQIDELNKKINNLEDDNEELEGQNEELDNELSIALKIPVKFMRDELYNIESLFEHTYDDHDQAVRVNQRIRALLDIYEQILNGRKFEEEYLKKYL